MKHFVNDRVDHYVLTPLPSHDTLLTTWQVVWHLDRNSLITSCVTLWNISDLEKLFGGICCGSSIITDVNCTITLRYTLELKWSTASTNVYVQDEALGNSSQCQMILQQSMSLQDEQLANFDRRILHRKERGHIEDRDEYCDSYLEFVALSSVHDLALRVE